MYFIIFAHTIKQQMDKDFIKALGYKALDSRLKRISDRIAHDIRKLYKELEIDIEPGWYLVFMLLKEKSNITIAEIAERLNYAHPSVVVIIKKMVARGYVVSEKDATDKRKQLISMTRKAEDLLPQMEKLWQSCETAMLEILGQDLGIFTHLDGVDTALKNTTFYERFSSEYNKNK